MWRRSVSRRSPPTSAEHPRRQPGGGRGLEHRRDPAGGEQLGPAAQRVGDLVGEVVAAGVELGGGVAEEAGERGRPHPRAAVRLLQRLEQRQPLDGGRGGEDAAAAGDHRRDADRVQRLLGGGEVGVAVADDRDVAAARAAGRRSVAPDASSAADVEGEVARRCAAGPGRR